jgi:hypothetical protein
MKDIIDDLAGVSETAKRNIPCTVTGCCIMFSRHHDMEVHLAADHIAASTSVHEAATYTGTNDTERKLGLSTVPGSDDEAGQLMLGYFDDSIGYGQCLLPHGWHCDSEATPFAGDANLSMVIDPQLFMVNATTTPGVAGADTPVTQGSQAEDLLEQYTKC